MTRKDRPYLSIQDIKSITPGLISYMQKKALDRINSAIDDIYDNTHALALRSLFFRLYDTEYLQRDEIAKIFAMIKPVVEFHVGTRLSKGQIATVLNDVGHLQDGKIDLSYLVPTFDKHKNSVVTHILAMIKNNGIIEPIRNYIDILTTLNLNWPELEIMNKSSQSLNEGTYQPSPAIMIDMIKTFKGRPGLRPLMSSLFTYKNIGGDMAVIDNEAKATILPVLQKSVNSKNFQTLYGYLSQSAVLFSWPELQDIKLSMIPVMIRELDKYTEKPGYADTATYSAHMISMMKSTPNVIEQAKPQLVSAINQKKPQIMKDLLILFKHGNVGPVTSIIHDFRSIGVKWPELDAIKRSYDSMTKSWPDDDLMEAANASSEYINGLIDLATTGLWSDFSDVLTYTYSYDDLPQNLKKHLAGKLRKLFLQDFEEAAVRGNATKMSVRHDLMPYFNVSKQEVKLIADKNKQILMQKILQYIKVATSMRSLYAIVYNLKDMGVDWPELDTILKSLESSIVSSERPQQLNEIKSQLTHWQDEFALGFKSKNRHKIEYTQFSILAPHHDNAALLSQVSKMLADTHRSDVLNYLHKQLSATYRRAVLEGIPSVLNFMLIMTPSDWPELPALLTEYKDRFMQYYLSFFKHGDVTRYISDDEFDVFHKFGIDWPELKTLERSYHAEKQIETRLDEGDLSINRPRKLTDNDLSTIRKISAMLHKGNVGDALWTSFELPNRLDELNSIFQHYKTTIMKFLLKEVQKGTGTHLLEIVLDGLARQTIAWPELAIVKKTVYSNDYKNI